MAKVLHTGKRKDTGEEIRGFYMEHQPFTEVKGYIKSKSIIGPVKWHEVDITTVKPVVACLHNSITIIREAQKSPSVGPVAIAKCDVCGAVMGQKSIKLVYDEN